MEISYLKLGVKKGDAYWPFKETALLNVLNHTLWFLPNVNSCYAMANLLNQPQNKNGFYGDYKINICAGTEAGIGLEALRPVEKSMGNPLESKTITLTCGKLTTGVTVNEGDTLVVGSTGYLEVLGSGATVTAPAFKVVAITTMPDADTDYPAVKLQRVQ